MSHENLIVFNNLLKDCNLGGCSFSIYEYDKDNEYEVMKVMSTDLHQLVKNNYCQQSSMLSRRLCENCVTNYRKIQCYLNKDEVHKLALDWDLPFDNDIKIDTIKNIRHKEISLDPSWKVKHFKYTFNENLESYLEELTDYDAITFGDFNKSLLPLRKLPKLKCIVGGFWFSADINELSGLKNLETIYVGKLYDNRDLVDDIYKITYFDRVGRAPFDENI